MTPFVTVLKELYDAPNVTDGIKIWDSQKSSIWVPINEDGISRECSKEIRQMTRIPLHEMSNLFVVDPNSSGFKTQNEMEYAYDVLQIGKIFTDNVSKQYKICLWILYNSSHHKVEDLIKEIRTKWLQMNRVQCLDIVIKLKNNGQLRGYIMI